MPQSFDCPKCGAPLHYEPELNAETVTCPFCNETVIVPKELRDPTARPGERLVRARHTSTLRPLVTCVVVIVLIGVLISVGLTVASFSLTNSIKQGIQQAFVMDPTSTVEPASIEPASPTEVGVNRLTRMAPTMEALKNLGTQIAAEASAKVATQSAQATQSAELEAASNWPVAFSDNFVQDKNNWPSGSNDDELVTSNHVIENGKYTWTETAKQPNGDFGFPDMPGFTDAWTSVDVKFVEAPGDSMAEAGILFRRSVQHDFYYFAIDSRGQFGLLYYDSMKWSTLLDFENSDAIQPDQVNHLAVAAFGTRLVLMINGQTVGAYSVEKSTKGFAGLGVNMPNAGDTATVEFSNFSVNAPAQ